MGLVSLLPLLVWLIRLLSLATSTTASDVIAASDIADVAGGVSDNVTTSACEASFGQAADIASTKHDLGLSSSSSGNRDNGKDIDSKGEITGAGESDESDGFHEGIVDLWIHCVYGVCISYITCLLCTHYLTNVYTTLFISVSVLCTVCYTLYMNSKNSVYDVKYRVGYIVSLLSILLILLCMLYIISFGLAYILTLILTPIVYALILYIIKLN